MGLFGRKSGRLSNAERSERTAARLVAWTENLELERRRLMQELSKTPGEGVSKHGPGKKGRTASEPA